MRWSFRADSRLAPRQWETSLQSNAVSHWLGANLESALSLWQWWLWWWVGEEWSWGGRQIYFTEAERSSGLPPWSSLWRWNLPSTFRLTTRAVILTTFPFQCLFSEKNNKKIFSWHIVILLFYPHYNLFFITYHLSCHTLLDQHLLSSFRKLTLIPGLIMYIGYLSLVYDRSLPDILSGYHQVSSPNVVWEPSATSSCDTYSLGVKD